MAASLALSASSAAISSAVIGNVTIWPPSPISNIIIIKFNLFTPLSKKLKLCNHFFTALNKV
jgi:hypothetical protein